MRSPEMEMIVAKAGRPNAGRPLPAPYCGLAAGGACVPGGVCV
jgi:hypothetical protein